MKLSKLLKNRKAMTPLMIGIIVAASVIAVVFIVMAAVIPAMRYDVSMQIRPGTIKPYLSFDKGLEFFVMCDYADGEVWKVDILKGDDLWGSRTLIIQVEIARNAQTKVQITSFQATANVPLDQQADGSLLFVSGQEYIIRVYFRPIDSTIETMFSDTTYTY